MPYKNKKKEIEWISERRRRHKRRLVKMAGGKCQLCGYSKCVRALEFHHVVGNKDGNISRIYNRGWDRIVKEVQKTIMLCSNCHQEVHQRLENLQSDETVTQLGRNR